MKIVHEWQSYDGVWFRLQRLGSGVNDLRIEATTSPPIGDPSNVTGEQHWSWRAKEAVPAGVLLELERLAHHRCRGLDDARWALREAVSSLEECLSDLKDQEEE